ncbi:hypothetical protein D3C71_1378880 [compost metagenome]
MQHAAFSGLAHGRNHDDVAESTGKIVRLLALLQRLPTRRGPFEQHPAVHVIGQEQGLGLRDPGGVRHAGYLGQNLRAGVAAAHDQDALAGKGRR